MTAFAAPNNRVRSKISRISILEVGMTQNDPVGCTTRKGASVTYSRWKAAPECEQQLGRSLNANLPPEQRPYETGFLPQKAQPGLAVGSESEIGLSIVAFGNLQLFVSNRDSCFQFLVTGEREVINSIKTL